MEGDTNSEEVNHDCVGASVVFLMWCSVVVTEITTARMNEHIVGFFLSLFLII